MIPFVDILISLKWLLALYVCSLVGILIFVKKDDKYPILSYSVGKSVGVIGVAAIIWVLSLFKIVPFTFQALFIITLATITTVVFFRWRDIVGAIKNNWRIYIFIEIIYLAIFVVGIWFRVTHPKIDGIEKFMDSAIVSNLLRHKTGVPVDTWYAPDLINYYYFGHFIIAAIAKLSRTTVNYAFNLGSATTLALAGSSIFCLGWQLTKKKVVGFLALFLTLFASNTHPFFSIVGGVNNYFFFSSGRFVEQVINEYPLYSFVLGELHAQMLALIISTTFYGIVALLVLRESKYRLALAGIAGALVGLLGATNTFDVIMGYIVFGLVIIYFKFYKKIPTNECLKLLVAYIAASVFVVFFFLVSFKPGIGGIGISLFKTPLQHILMQFGLPLLISTGSFLILKQKQQFKKDEINLALIFGIAAILLIIIPEFVFLKDIYHFENPPFERANTVFKMWYSAWPLLALSVAMLAAYAIRLLKKNWQSVISFVVIIFCSVLLFGTYIGLKTLTDNQPNTLDGFSYIKQSDPDKLAVVDWANKNIKGQPVVVQAAGQSYTEQSWFSSYTGLSSPIGWESHEWGWRYNANTWPIISARADEVKQLYQAATSQVLKQQVSELKVNYILFGPDEQTAYKANKNILDANYGPPIYQNQKYSIYEVK